MSSTDQRLGLLLLPKSHPALPGTASPPPAIPPIVRPDAAASDTCRASRSAGARRGAGVLVAAAISPSRSSRRSRSRGRPSSSGGPPGPRRPEGTDPCATRTMRRRRRTARTRRIHPARPSASAARGEPTGRPVVGARSRAARSRRPGRRHIKEDPPPVSCARRSMNRAPVLTDSLPSMKMVQGDPAASEAYGLGR